MKTLLIKNADLSYNNVLRGHIHLMKIRVLVFPCGSEIGLEIHNALKCSAHIELFGASSVSSNHGKYIYRNYIDGLPFIDDPDFIKNLNIVIDKYKIDFIYPAHDSVVYKLSRFQSDLHCSIIGSEYKTCEICRSKKLTYQTFKSKVRTPKTYNINDLDLMFPLFLKPDVGQGSKGVHLVQTIEELHIFLKQDPSLLILEYLPGKEYTVDCFTDRYGNLRYSSARERIRTSNGISVDTKPVKGEEFRRLAEIINQVLQLRGAWFYQVKRDASNKLALMEIAPRIAGSMGIRRCLGVNLALLAVFDAAKVDIEVSENQFEIRMDRALFNCYQTSLEYRHVYLDLDDCLIIGNKFNLLLITFLYQCIGNKIKIHLLTRHKGDINLFIKESKIEHLFDSINYVDQYTPKSSYIKEMPSIFIDDSFSERAEVKEKLGIPVLDPSALECLIDWRL
jgi:Fe-S-cluster containining protein